MTIESTIIALAGKEFAAKVAEISLKKLAGDASTRNYFRVVGGEKSLIACYYPDLRDSLERSVEFSGFLLKNGIPVNRLLSVDKERGIVLIEDLGDEQLYGLKGEPWEILEPKLQEGLELLAKINALPFHELKTVAAPFDIDFWIWELRLFTKYYLGEMRGITDSTKIIEQIRAILSIYGKYGAVFSHRDYHSKNLMLNHGEMFVIDYQDARGGPVEYDLASFLRDAYLKIPEEIELRLLKHFFDISGQSDYTDFLHRYYRISVQRSLKAVGTFAYQAVERKNKSYLKYIENSLNNAIDAAQKTGFSLDL